ncbi:MAG TPA: bifunctional DNA-formamidopyrimidine glycosylase/DNA-(apurinic or apyrimidinic site) lyase [Candidatus Acidoferrum sp.]|nr:bifunctional DNA-formamidopyrimidine glycosylase/DNA-(apurinic or apyrimidinic site) lyase [Candidatus Acidoferrum sp.]
MPELPEVETVRLGLERLLTGREVKTVQATWAKSFPNDELAVQSQVVGARVTAVRRRAKVLMIELSSGYSLVTHLKMTGQLVFRDGAVRFGAGHPNGSLVGELPDKSTRVIFTFVDGSKLFFNDQRKFGWMRLLPTAEVPNIDFFQKVGPEPLDNTFTAEAFVARIRRRPKSTIKAVLLDQTVVAGVGNIYADESLFAAKIHPAQRVVDVGDEQLKLLYQELRRILKLSIEKGGSTDKNYVDAEGKKGSYLSFAQVFRREGLACPRCGATIIKLRVAGRGTHICPVCQVAAH